MMSFLRRALALTIVCLSPLVGLSSSAHAAPSPGALVATALHDAVTSRGVDEIDKLTSKGSPVFEAQNNIGPVDGIQVTAIANGGRAIVTGFPHQHVAYVQANSLGLEALVSFPAGYATQYSDKVIRVTSKDSQYASVVAATTLASDFSQVRFVGHLSVKSVSYAGVAAYAVSGTVPAMNGAPRQAGVLYISRSAHSVPLAFVQKIGTLVTTVAWSKWGATPHLTQPTSWTACPQITTTD